MRKIALAGTTCILLLIAHGHPHSSTYADVSVHDPHLNQEEYARTRPTPASTITATQNEAAYPSGQPATVSSTTVMTTTYIYDSNGNLISDGESCYAYNDANQLSAVRDCATDDLVAEYLYDHTGQRIVERLYEDGELVDSVYTIGEIYETRVGGDGTQEDTSYYRANGELVASKNSDDSISFYHPDHLGSVSGVTDGAGELIEETRYYPYGAVRQGGTVSRYLYTGQESDPEIGFYYYRTRFYDPSLRRFAQPDSIIPDAYNPQQLDRYSYVTNNPMAYVDPSGMWGTAAEGGMNLGPIDAGMSLSIEDLSFGQMIRKSRDFPTIFSYLMGNNSDWLPEGGDVRLSFVEGASIEADEMEISRSLLGVYSQVSWFIQEEDFYPLHYIADTQQTTHAGMTVNMRGLLAVSIGCFTGEQNAGIELGVSPGPSPPIYLSMSRESESFSLVELRSILSAFGHFNGEGED